MNLNLLALISFLSPLAFIATAVVSYFQPGLRPQFLKRMAVSSTIISMIVAAISGYLVVQNGLLESSFFGLNGLGFSLRLDSVSIVMFSMIAIISFIVIRFSLNYLDGDARQGAFIGRLAAAIAAVQLLVLSGNLGLLFIAWVFTSMSLHRLLIFYHERPGAIISARKKFIVARLGDTLLFSAIAIMYAQFGTGNLEIIFQSIKNSIALGTFIPGIEIAAILFASAALLKSAQFPFHGWLIEVMETPTPVSALLHAGLLNAGPFLIIRLGYVMEASTYASIVLISLGGFTALFASVIFLTQTSVKTALGYSSVAHMGFSLMVCGLGVYAAAMLHLVAHSFYKAHAFLSTGSVIDVMRSNKVSGSKRLGSPFRIALGIVLGVATYAGFAVLWGIDPAEDFALLAIGAIIVMGLSRLFAAAIDSDGSTKLILNAIVWSIIVTAAFFILESATHYLLVSELPEAIVPSLTEKIIIVSILILFALTVFVQIAAPMWKNKLKYKQLGIHIRNGLYVNTIFDRMVRAIYAHDKYSTTVSKESLELMFQQKQETVTKVEQNPA
jgi:NAD(P)H-quinone oxidoreductase subunit 5